MSGGPRRPDAEAIAGLDSFALIESVPQAVVVVDTRETVVGFNHAAEHLLGFTRADVCGRRLDDCLEPYYGNGPVGAALGRLFAAAPAHPVRRQLSLRHRAGHRVQVELELTVIPGSAGPLACVFMTDVTRHLAVEERADRNAGYLAALLDSLSVGVAACDAEGRIVLMNRALRELHGLPATGDVPIDFMESLNGKLYDADHQAVAVEDTPLMRALAGEYVPETDLVIEMPGHRERRLSVTARPIVGGDGGRRGAVVVSHEVTALRRVERFRACHREVERALTSAVSVPEATPRILEAVVSTLGWSAAELYLVEETTGELRAVGHWSASGEEPEEFFGHTPVKGEGVTGRVWESGRPGWIPELSDAVSLRTEFERTRVGICLRHGIHSVLAVPVSDGRSLLGVLTCYAGAAEYDKDLLTVLLEGVAAQIGVFVALRRAEELGRQLARAQDDFISLVGHELRTPLTAITANVSVLADDQDRRAEDDPLLESIARNAGELQEMVGTLLELAGLDSGHLPLEVAPVDLAALLGAVVAATVVGTPDHTLRFHAETPDAVVIDGDAERLGQVLEGLLSNAVNYSPEGGAVEITLRTDGEIAELRITDDGIGTPTEERDHVFERFYRGSNVRHQGTHGHGLGLSLARTIVQLHGGSLRLTDHQPSGTTVIVRLPHHHDAAHTVRRV
ncbi:PAS domain-containing sensor histidine kinase [Actinoplanes sp. NPDC049548]|uniref:PAS domain-containing sensor histidine kinase n=1 Tax=Actinoplanes sp. NPDC049548 TaxID=3155152 RepID=UPI0034213575